MAETEITRKQVIVVDEVGSNTYGDMTFTDKGGGAYKISNKRKQYFEKVIVPDMAVQLNYAMSAFGKEYIYSATQVKDMIPDSPAKSAPPITVTPVKSGQSNDDARNRSMALAYAKDVVCAGKVDLKGIFKLADKFHYYILNKGVNSLVEEAKKLGAVKEEEIPF